MTTTSTLTPAQHLAAVRHLAGGKPLDVVATILGTTREIVLDVASKHGYPDTQKLGWAADILSKNLADADAPTEHPDAAVIARDQQRPTIRPAAGSSTPPAAGHTTTPAAPDAPAPAQAPSEHHSLIDRGKQHPSKRIQNAANKVLDDLERLRTLLREDEEKHAARRQAQAEKAAAKAEIDRLAAELAAARAKLRGGTAPKTTAADSDGPSAAEVRAWAAENGVECPPVGRVPKAVRAAYDAAHSDENDQ